MIFPHKANAYGADGPDICGSARHVYVSISLQTVPAVGRRCRPKMNVSYLSHVESGPDKGDVKSEQNRILEGPNNNDTIGGYTLLASYRPLNIRYQNRSGQELPKTVCYCRRTAAAEDYLLSLKLVLSIPHISSHLQGFLDCRCCRNSCLSSTTYLGTYLSTYFSPFRHADRHAFSPMNVSACGIE